MQRDVLEQAIVSLDLLLNADVSDEASYQEWFEAHPIVLQALGYGRVLSHPRMVSVDGEVWIPDFLVQASNGSWEVFELKTPQASILIDRQRRSKFYSSFDTHIKQCREYARAFDDPRTRLTFEDTYNLTIHKDLRSTVVAGRSSGLDARLVHELATASYPPVTVLTFDDIRARLEQYRTFSFGDYEEASGLGLIFVLVLRRPPSAGSDNHIFDVGASPYRDRVSVFVDAQSYLRLELFDSNGSRHSARSALPLESGDFDVPHVFVFSVGVGDRFGFLSIEIDRKYRADIRIEDFPFAVSRQYVLGSDITGTSPSWMCVGAFIDVAGPPSFKAKALVQAWGEKRSLTGPAEPWFVFEGHQSLRSEGHPYPSAPSGAPTHGPCPGLSSTAPVA